MHLAFPLFRCRQFFLRAIDRQQERTPTVTAGEHRIGARKLLWIGGIGTVPLSAGWLISQHFAWLVVLQIIGGISWAAYELAFFLLFFESIKEEERTSVLTLYNLLNTAAGVVGALIGGPVIFSSGGSFRGYMLVLGCSAVGRLAALLLQARVPRIVVDSDEMGVRTVAVRPGASPLDASILPSLPGQRHDANELRSARDKPLQQHN